MNIQVVTTPSGERMVMMSEAEFQTLLASAEDAADRAALADFRRDLDRNVEELVPAELLDRMLAGESRIKVWRRHRGLTMAELARRADLSQPFLSQLENGKRDGTVDVLRRIADILNVTLDDIAG